MFWLLTDFRDNLFLERIKLECSYILVTLLRMKQLTQYHWYRRQNRHLAPIHATVIQHVPFYMGTNLALQVEWNETVQTCRQNLAPRNFRTSARKSWLNGLCLMPQKKLWYWTRNNAIPWSCASSPLTLCHHKLHPFLGKCQHLVSKSILSLPEHYTCYLFLVLKIYIKVKMILMIQSQACTVSYKTDYECVFWLFLKKMTIFMLLLPLAGADPGEVKRVNFHPPFSEPPSFFFFLSLKYWNNIWFFWHYYKNSPPISKSWIRLCIGRKFKRKRFVDIPRCFVVAVVARGIHEIQQGVSY